MHIPIPQSFFMAKILFDGLSPFCSSLSLCASGIIMLYVNIDYSNNADKLTNNSITNVIYS